MLSGNTDLYTPMNTGFIRLKQSAQIMKERNHLDISFVEKNV